LKLLYHLQIVEMYTTGEGINENRDRPLHVMLNLVIEIQEHAIWRHALLGVHARSLALPIAMRAVQICIGQCVKTNNNINTPRGEEVKNTVEESTIDNLTGHLVQLLLTVEKTEENIGVENRSPALESLPPMRDLLIDTLMTSIDCLVYLLTWNICDITVEKFYQHGIARERKKGGVEADREGIKTGYIRS
jgi:hypothetical protein